MLKTEIRRRKKQFSYKLLAIVCLLFVIGIIIGSISAIIANNGDSSHIGSFIDTYFNNDINNGITSQDILITWIKEAKYVVVIILCGFLSFGIIPSSGILIFRGLSYGFTCATMLCQYGAKGIYYIFSLCLIQGFFTVPAFIFITYCNIELILSLKSNNIRRSSKGEFNKAITEYVILGVGCILACLIGAIFETCLINIIF